MAIQPFNQEQITPTVQEWQETLKHLVDEVSQWVHAQQGWSHLISEKTISEEQIGTYQASVLTIDTGKGRLVLEPMARIVFGGRGTVELYAWPTLYRVRLLRPSNKDEWVILTDSGIKLKQAWNQETFISLVQDLLGVE